MEYTYFDVVILGVKASGVGLVLGLIIRILRTKMPIKYFFHATFWSIVNLVLFPFLLFPIVISIPKYKTEFIKLMSESIHSQAKEIPLKQIKRRIKENWSWKLVMLLWLATIRYVSANYDDYVELSMSAIKERLLLKSRHSSTKFKISDFGRQTKIFENYEKLNLCGF